MGYWNHKYMINKHINSVVLFGHDCGQWCSIRGPSQNRWRLESTGFCMIGPLHPSEFLNSPLHYFDFVAFCLCIEIQSNNATVCCYI